MSFAVQSCRFFTVMRKIFLFLLLLAGCACYLRAENTGRLYLSGDSVVTSGSADIMKKSKSRNPVKDRKKEYMSQRIDREIAKLVFIPQGQWIVGGTFSYSEHEENNLNFLVLKNIEDLGYTFKVSPYVGYFFKNNMSAGVRFAYNRTYLDMSNFEVNLGEDFKISLKDLYYLEHNYEVSGFLRTYVPLGKSKIFGLFNELRLTYAYGVGKNSTGSGTEYDGTFERANMLQLGIAPGLTAFVTNWSAVEVSIGVMGYGVEWKKQRTNQVEEGYKRTSSGNFKINLFSINIGMTFFL